jgi:4-alpha-glucanotransferase
MNVPGRADGNWRWRCSETMLSDAPFAWLQDLTRTSNRWNHLDSTPLGIKSANEIEVTT